MRQLVLMMLFLGYASCSKKYSSTPVPADTKSEQGESGLIYTPLAIGSGPSPTKQDKVIVHYRGTLADGTEFDNSYKRGEPTKFPLFSVIDCWSEAIPKMKAGGKAKLVCPPNIAYGGRGSPPAIPPSATLTFEIELLDVL